MDKDLQSIRPDAFIGKSYNFVSGQTIWSPSFTRCLRMQSPVGDRKLRFNVHAESTDCIKGYNMVDPRISSNRDVASSAAASHAGNQHCPSFDSATEVSGSSQGSISSQDTSFYSSIEACNAPVASMTDPAEFSGSSPTEVSNSAIVPHPPTAGRLKRTYSVAAIGKLHKAKRLNGKYDPENHEIMRLRQEEDLDFQEIADRLNEERHKNGGRDDLTDNAVYSRYTRNAPLIAQMRNEKFTPTIKV